MIRRTLFTRLAVSLFALALASGVYAAAPEIKRAENWYTGGRDLDGTYFSPLTQINTDNVSRLGFAWQATLDGMRGQEATPIVIDGVMYTSGSWGYVYAFDAATGRTLWRYDAKPTYQAARNACCDLVNRGVAVQDGIVYVVAIDGRMHAIDAATGKKIWEADTVADHSLPYASTGAPQIAGKLVVIGNSGSDMGRGGIRGYVSAYDLRSGELRWRFYTVPPAVGAPYENPELRAADETWDRHRAPQFKGGGSAWDGLAYDSALNLVYFGTANAAPYDLRQLGPSNGDCLYTASIVALHGDSGRMAWYYQTTPGDHWDYDSTQKLVLGTLKIAGVDRHVLMQASKNGFFYVIDRRTGELLSAKNYTYVNWTQGIDGKTGRPAIAAASDWSTGPRMLYPSWAGGHTWNPMAFNPISRLVYIPAIDAGSVWVDMAHNGGPVTFSNGTFTANTIIADSTYDASELSLLYGPMPDLATLGPAGRPAVTREILRAWDPVKQKVAWEHETSSGARGYDGGVMTTASNLVFQGQGNGDLVVYAADSGRRLAAVPTGSHIMAAPMTYIVKGEQYVAVQVGYGGTGVGVPFPPSSAAARFRNINRVIALKLGNRAVPTPPLRTDAAFPEPPPSTVSDAVIAAGEVKFFEDCAGCHAFGPNITFDLRQLPLGIHGMFNDIVLRGALAPLGMERFDDLLSEDDANAIHAYLISESWKAYSAQGGAHR
jgi:quinohemoprotein ethanol dehydrogenase